MRVAVAKYRIEAPTEFAAFAARQREAVAEASALRAQLLVLPEYLALELAASFDAATRADLAASMAALQSLHAAYCRLFAGLAQEFDVDIQAGTFLLGQADGSYRNRAYWFAADGTQVHQDKLQLTAFEKALGLLQPGDRVGVIERHSQRIGMAVCYDCEFPLPVRAQCEAGAKLLVVPSCTDSAAGASRVEVGCLARALENRIFVAKAVTAGSAPWSPALDCNTGEAAIYAPMDRGLPDDGVLARTRGDQRWALAELAFAALEASRATAQVANDRDWPDQLRPGLRRAQLLGRSTVVADSGSSNEVRRPGSQRAASE